MSHEIRIALLAAAFLTGAGPGAAAIPDSMHPDFTLSEAALPGKYRCTGLQPLPDGRMALAVIEDVGSGAVGKPNAATGVFIITGVEGASPRLKEVANNFMQIAGIVEAEGKLYVSDRDGFYELSNLDDPGDLKANRRLIVKWPDEKTWPNGFQWHQWVFTPMYRDGFFYAPYSGSIIPGGPSRIKPTTEFSGAFLKWDLAGKLEKYAGGLRSPNGAGIAPNGDMFVADNQGSWLPSSTFMRMKPGKFYGHSNTYLGHLDNKNFAESLPYERPTAWLDNQNVRVSPGQPVYIHKGAFAGDWLLGDCNHPGLVRISLDNVGGIENGSVFWFGKGTANAAINRMAWGKDGSLYLGTLTGIGNWPSGEPKPLYRLTPKAEPAAFDMRRVSSVAGGLEILFTQPVDKTVTAAAFQAQQWNYKRGEGYGEGKGNAEGLKVDAVGFSADGLRVHLAIAGLKEDYVAYLRLGAVKSAAGKPLWNNEAWFTLNKQATRAWDPASSLARPAPASPLHGRIAVRSPGGRGLEVSLDASGPHTFSLYGLDGSLWARVEGSGSAPQAISARGHSGLCVLEVRQGAASWRRPVALTD